MGELAETRLTAMQEDEKSSASDRFVWAGFTRFIYLSCCHDVEVALDIATKSESHRQIVTSQLLNLRALFEAYRFNVGMWRQQSLNTEERQTLLQEARGRVLEADQIVDRTRQDYLLARADDSESLEWLRTHFEVPASTVLDQWSSLESSIEGGTFYTPVSLDEVTQIVKSFGFSHVGHWYACQNGHAFVITYVGRFLCYSN